MLPKAIDYAEEISHLSSELKADMQPAIWLGNQIGEWPKIGPYLKMLEPGLDYILNLSNAFIVGGQAIENHFFDYDHSIVNLTADNLSEFLAINKDTFNTTEVCIRKAIASRMEIELIYIPEEYRDEFMKLDEILDYSPLAFTFLRSAPTILGTNKPITYLLMVQNRDELRPAGGFITAFGLVRLRDGRIIGLDIEDSTSERFDYVSEVREAPFPLNEIMFAHYFVPRDANWSPDFPTSARITQEMYSLSTEIETDAVIAFDQRFIVSLLEFTGPVDFPEENTIVDSINVERKMIEYKQYAIDANQYEKRKDFLAILAPHIIEKVLMTKNFVELKNLLLMMREAIETGHLLVYFDDQDVQNLLEEFNLSGSVVPKANDFIMLIDSNVGIGKIDKFIERSLSYRIDLSNFRYPTSEIIITYDHKTVGNEPCLQGVTQFFEDPKHKDYNFSRCYWNYWRVLRPANTTLLIVNTGRFRKNISCMRKNGMILLSFRQERQELQ